MFIKNYETYERPVYIHFVMFLQVGERFWTGGLYPLSLLDMTCFSLAYLNLKGKDCINFLTTSHIFTFSLKLTVFSIYEVIMMNTFDELIR